MNDPTTTAPRFWGNKDMQLTLTAQDNGEPRLAVLKDGRPKPLTAEAEIVDSFTSDLTQARSPRFTLEADPSFTDVSVTSVVEGSRVPVISWDGTGNNTFQHNYTLPAQQLEYPVKFTVVASWQSDTEPPASTPDGWTSTGWTQENKTAIWTLDPIIRLRRKTLKIPPADAESP